MATKTATKPRADQIFGITMGEPIIEVPPESIVANPNQPRTVFDEEEHQDLTASIREHGVQQPLVIRTRKLAPHEKSAGERKYELVSGERRLRAAKAAGLLTVPCIVREYKSDVEAYMAALIENVQRENLTAEDEVRAVETMRNEFLLSNRQISQALGKPEGWISNRVSAVNAPKFIRDLLRDFQQSISFVPVIRAAKSDALQRELVDKVRATPSISVRALTEFRNEREKQLGLRERTESTATVTRPAATPAVQGTGMKVGGRTDFQPAPEPTPEDSRHHEEFWESFDKENAQVLDAPAYTPDFQAIGNDLRARAQGVETVVVLTPEEQVRPQVLALASRIAGASGSELAGLYGELGALLQPWRE